MKRKRYKVGDVLNISIGRVWAEGLPKLSCFVCGEQAKAWPYDGAGMPSPVAYGVAQIDGTDRDGPVPLCIDCFNSSQATMDAIYRKITGAPDLIISDGGELKSEADLADVIDAARGKTKGTATN